MNKTGKLFIIEGNVRVVRDDDMEHWTVNRRSLATAVANQLGVLWDGKELKLGRVRMWLERLE